MAVFRLCSIVWLLVCCSNLTFGQQAKTLTAPYPLHPGDTIPEALWDTPLQMVGKDLQGERSTLSAYKGKLVIIDFWATWCGPCVAMLPRMDSLQRQFDGDVQFVSVTYQSEEEVMAYLDKLSHQKGLNIRIPKAVENTWLKGWFPHATIPHYIWIDATGVVQGITGHREITYGNIAQLLTKGSLDVKVKNETPSLGYPMNQITLMEFLAYNKPEYLRDFTHRSALSGYIDGLGGGAITIQEPTEAVQSWRFTATNVSLRLLFSFAFGEGASFLNAATIAIECTDSLLISPPYGMKDFKEWIRQHTYCYELVVPESRSVDGFQVLQDQLNVLFAQYRIVIEDRLMPALALERVPGVPLKPSSADKFTYTYDGFTYLSSGERISGFVSALNGIYLSHNGKPVVDHTGFDHPIDLTLNAKMSNVESLNAALKDHGLRLVEKEAIVKMLVIKDASPVAEAL